MEVDMVHGRFGEFAVLVDGDVVAHSGAPSMIGIVPTAAQVLRAVRARLSAAPRARS